MLINARLSPRSFARWRRAPGLAHALLGGFDRVQARSEADAGRLRSLGAATRRSARRPEIRRAAAAVRCRQSCARLQAMLADRPVWLAASTHPGEEALVFAVHRQLAASHPGLLTILAPRHPERGAASAAEAAPLPVTRRARGEGPPPTAGRVGGGYAGRDGAVVSLASIAFVGRSLVPPGGGQNPLEPARLGCAVAVGPHTGNFDEHVALLREAEAAATVADADALAGFVTAMLADPAERDAWGAARWLRCSGRATWQSIRPRRCWDCWRRPPRICRLRRRGERSPPWLVAAGRAAAPPALAPLRRHRGRDRPAPPPPGLVLPRAGDLCRQRHPGRGGQDHRHARSRPAAGGARLGRPLVLRGYGGSARGLHWVEPDEPAYWSATRRCCTLRSPPPGSAPTARGAPRRRWRPVPRWC